VEKRNVPGRMSQSRGSDHYPRFKLPRFWWLIQVAGALVGLFLLLFPDVADLELPSRIGFAAGAIILPLVFAVLVHLARVLVVFLRRASCYDVHTTEIEELRERVKHLQTFVTWLIQEGQDRNAFLIDHCFAYDARTFIVLRKKPRTQLAVGTQVVVVDMQTGAAMGEFQVSEQDGRGCHCELKGHVDALWLGHIKENGNQPSQVPPEWRAIARSRTTGDENE